MAKTISITVPEDLHAKMVEYKKRFNYSKIFQKALLGEIVKKDHFKLKLKEKNTIYDYLITMPKGTDFRSALEWFRWGQSVGFAFAKISSYLQMKQFEPYSSVWNEGSIEQLKEFRKYRLDQVRIFIDSAKKRFALPKGDELRWLMIIEYGLMKGIIDFLNEEWDTSYGPTLDLVIKIAFSAEESDLEPKSKIFWDRPQSKKKMK